MSWNQAATRVFGYQPDEIIGRSILQLIPPELHHEQDEILRKLKAGERIEHHETVRIGKSGEQIAVSVAISPIKDETGRVIGGSKITRDISARKKNDEIRFRLAAIVDSADDAIVSKDLNGIVNSWNQGAQRMFGYAADEMIGQPILRLIPDELHYEEEQILRTLRAGDRVDHYETTRRKKNGDPIEVSVTISPIREETGQVIGASKIARDISDRKRIERLLIQAEQELERVSHIARQTLGY